jgi:hypothetical protein
MDRIDPFELMLRMEWVELMDQREVPVLGAMPPVWPPRPGKAVTW